MQQGTQRRPEEADVGYARAPALLADCIASGSLQAGGIIGQMYMPAPNGHVAGQPTSSAEEKETRDAKRCGDNVVRCYQTRNCILDSTNTRAGCP